jgi:hypothetical protein
VSLESGTIHETAPVSKEISKTRLDEGDVASSAIKKFAAVTHRSDPSVIMRANPSKAPALFH